jgi:hypothetical protein
MANAEKLVQLRERIAEIYRGFISSSSNGIASIDEIMQVIKSELDLEIKAVESDLVDLMLRRFVHDVGKRKERRVKGIQETDLFEGYKRIPQSISIDGRNKKRTAKLSLAEAETYLKKHSPQAISDQHQEFRRLVEDCRAFWKSESDTLETLMERRAEAEAKNI